MLPKATCPGSTPCKTRGFDYTHACKLEKGHDGDCICVGCRQSFKPDPPLQKKIES
jgi:hypothetical protein